MEVDCKKRKGGEAAADGGAAKKSKDNAGNAQVGCGCG